MAYRLGLTGSIGTGKSTTAQMFRDAGIPVHDSDAVVHQLYKKEAIPPIEAAFPGTTTRDGVDRKKLGTRVVGNPDALKKLEKIVIWCLYVLMILWSYKKEKSQLLDLMVLTVTILLSMVGIKSFSQY